MEGQREVPGRVGERVARRYRLVRTVGSGGMGVVYEAVDEALGRPVAIKVLGRDEPAAAARMLREAKVVAQIDHPNVVRLFDVGREDPKGDAPEGPPFLVMELLAGRDLGRVIAEEGRQRVPRAVRFVLEAAAGIAAAHARGVVHRDIKPSNLFLQANLDRVTVLDFGASRGDGIDGDAALTRTAGYVGTPLYAAPEQLADATSADARSDVWSLGLVLYELLSATRPFQRATLAAVGAAIVRDDAPPLDDVPAGLEGVVRRCLEKEAARRFASVPALARALAPWAEAGLVDAVASAANHKAGASTALDASATLVRSSALESALTHDEHTTDEGVVVPRADAVPSLATVPSATKRSRRWVVGGGAVLTALLVGGAVWHRAEPPESAASAPTPMPIATAEPTADAPMPEASSTAPAPSSDDAPPRAPVPSTPRVERRIPAPASSTPIAAETSPATPELPARDAGVSRTTAFGRRK